MNESKFQVYNPFGHIRLQNISLTYNLSSLTQKIGIKNARLTLSGRNLFFIAPGWKLSDPQNRSGDGVGMPRTVTLGLNVTF